jgi:hypothetical protein
MLVDNSWIFRVPKNIRGYPQCQKNLIFSKSTFWGGGGQNVDERMNIFSKVIWSDAILQKRFGRYLCTYRYIGTLIPEQSAFFFFLSTRSA